MDVVCNIALVDGTIITLDGFDKIHFYNEIPEPSVTYSAYDFDREKYNYYNAMNDLSKYPFVGIERKDNSDELVFANKSYAYNNYHKNADITLEANEVLYLQSSSVTTIARLNP